jgi:hypothetical protein
MEDKPHIEITQFDIESLLAGSERDEQIIVAPQRADEPRQELDEQILAGLVTPF